MTEYKLVMLKVFITPEPFMISDFCAISAFSSILLNLSGG